MPFKRFTHVEADVSAALMGSASLPYILNSILTEAHRGRLQSFKLETSFDSGSIIEFRYKDTTEFHKLVEGKYLIVLNDGSLMTADAETFEATYKWIDPAEKSIVGQGIVGKARLIH